MSFILIAFDVTFDGWFVLASQPTPRLNRLSVVVIMMFGFGIIKLACRLP